MNEKQAHFVRWWRRLDELVALIKCNFYVQIAHISGHGRKDFYLFKESDDKACAAAASGVHLTI